MEGNSEMKQISIPAEVRVDTLICKLQKWGRYPILIMNNQSSLLDGLNEDGILNRPEAIAANTSIQSAI